MADVTTLEVATGLIGVLNNPHWVYERGERRVSFDGAETIIPALSGKTVTANAARIAEIDSAYRVRSGRLLHVRYLGASRVERGRATDELSLNYLGGKRKWRAGQVISQYKVRISHEGGQYYMGPHQ